MKTILLVFAAIVGSMLGVLAYLAIDYQIQLAFAADELGVWTQYGCLIFAGAGIVPGIAMGRGAFALMNKPRTHVPEPSLIPAVDLAVPSRRRNIRPLTWMYRA
jgi:hypothetical protein